MISNIPYITQILKIEPFKITCLWNTGEVMVNDFEEEFNSQKRVKPMRSAITKNKKEDANMYRNIDPKRFHKKK